MTTILRRVPIFEQPSEVLVADERVPIKPYQIIVWVSLSPQNVLVLDPRTPRFPAILDTGHNHNFAIREQHLTTWAGLPDTVPPLGAIDLRGTRLPLLAANVWVHPNRAGTRDELSGRPPVPLELPRGIAVYPRDVPNPARLPVLGLRALVVNNLRLSVDGKLRQVTLRTQGWF
jgi:hypothetical protein